MLQTLDRGPKPLPQCFFDLRLCVLPLHGVDGLSVGVERNVMTGYVFTQGTDRNEVGEQAFAAWPRTLGIVPIDARSGVLEDGRRLPRCFQ